MPSLHRTKRPSLIDMDCPSLENATHEDKSSLARGQTRYNALHFDNDINLFVLLICLLVSMPYLTSEALAGLKAYVYKPAGYTWLDNLHQPLWNCALYS